MKSHRLRAALAAGAIAAAVTVGLALGTRLPGASALGPVEHKVILLSYDDYKELEEFKQAEKELKSQLAAVFRMHEIALVELGKQGWELVSVEGKTPAQTVFYLKRKG